MTVTPPAGEKPEEGTTEKVEANISYETFDEYLATQDPGIAKLYEVHTEGLKSALQKERESRSKLSDALKELQPQAEKGSELEAKLSETLKELELANKLSAEAERKAGFVDMVIKPEIGCTNPKVAYALAVSEGLFSDKNEPDFVKLKELAPELFKTSTIGSTDGGRRTATMPNEGDINYQIRKQSGIVE